jgi:hypothetical protein
LWGPQPRPRPARGPKRTAAAHLRRREAGLRGGDRASCGRGRRRGRRRRGEQRARRLRGCKASE